MYLAMPLPFMIDEVHCQETRYTESAISQERHCHEKHQHHIQTVLLFRIIYFTTVMNQNPHLEQTQQSLRFLPVNPMTVSTAFNISGHRVDLFCYLSISLATQLYLTTHTEHRYTSQMNCKYSFP
jgi:hypothetical protein